MSRPFGALIARHVLAAGLHLVGNQCHVDSQGFIVVAPHRMLDIMTPAITPSTMRPMTTGTLKLDHVTPHRELRKPSVKEFSMHTRCVHSRSWQRCKAPASEIDDDQVACGQGLASLNWGLNTERCLYLCV